MIHIWKISLIGVLFTFLVFPPSIAWANGDEKPPPGAGYKQDEILVKFATGVSQEEIASINARMGTEIIKRMGAVYLLRIPETARVESMVDQFTALPEVAYAEPNYIVTIQE